MRERKSREETTYFDTASDEDMLPWRPHLSNWCHKASVADLADIIAHIDTAVRLHTFRLFLYRNNNYHIN